MKKQCVIERDFASSDVVFKFICVYDAIDSSYQRIVVCIFHVVDVKIVF